MWLYEKIKPPLVKAKSFRLTSIGDFADSGVSPNQGTASDQSQRRPDGGVR
jgi:hypothetical protein